MSLAIKALTGPVKDQIFPLIEGLTVGRQGAGIALNDGKVSSLHARFVRHEMGNWTIEDNNSKNGVRVDGEKVASLDLVVGALFMIGDTQFVVVELSAEPVVDIPKPAKKQRYWYDVLAEYLDKNKDEFEDKPKGLSVLEPALVLEFVRGVQATSKWVLGFGPRKVGAASLDLPIWEPGAPAVCFEILPSSDGLVFKTAHPDIVLLNGAGVDSEVLRMGDTIRIMDTIIEVDFTE